jgi:nitrite reductase/ring-hydroxylating ferredoxin subunit
MTRWSATTVMAQPLLRWAPDRARPGRIADAVSRLERTTALDGAIGVLRDGVHAVALGDVRDLLHGRFLGHPVHPLLVQVPVGAWLSSAVLDWTPGGRRQAGLLVAVGLAGAVPAAAAGLADWAELEDEQARVGLGHALLNVVATSCYTMSLASRLIGHRGRKSALFGLAAVAVSGALGGHLAYHQAAGANHSEATPRITPPGWHDVGAVADFPDGRPVRRLVGEVAVLVLRDADGALSALADRCSHLGGPLSDGEITDGCVRCPWHGSTFRLSDGWNVTGPATAPQPCFDTRVTDGRVWVRLRTAAPADDPAPAGS